VSCRLLSLPILTIGIALGCSSPDLPEGRTEQPVRIHEIQGADHESPLTGRHLVQVRGVVTASVADRTGRSIWIQDPEGDNDPATSEALAVVLEEHHPMVRAGDAVSVSGVVEERGHPSGLTTTTLMARSVRATGRGRLPEPVMIGQGGRPIPTEGVDDDGLAVFEPARDAIDFFESLEGMRVRVAEAVVVGPTTRYREIAVLADGGAGVSPRTANGGLALRPNGANPTRILIGDRLLPDPPMLRVGERMSSELTGILDYSFGNFKLYNTDPVPARVGEGAQTERTELEGGVGKLTVATFNVENLSSRSNDSKFGRLGRIIARELLAPDIVALQEIQDDSGPEDDGTVGAAETLERLVDEIADSGGPAYEWRQIDPSDGGDGGARGANIRVAFLFNRSRVRFIDRNAEDVEARVVEGPSLAPNPGLVAPTHPAFAGNPGRGFDGSRKPLAGEFVFSNRRVFVVNLHLSSKRGDDALFGRRQPPRRPSQAQRLEQARAIREFVERILDRNPQAAVIVLGDLNDFEYRPPVRHLSGDGLVNLVERVSAEDRYSYIFQGFSQTLDHILVSPSLAQGAEIDMVHLNADFPVSERASDHDPIVARFTFR
jgi:predicted extracellular nuclease